MFQPDAPVIFSYFHHANSWCDLELKHEVERYNIILISVDVSWKGKGKVSCTEGNWNSTGIHSTYIKVFVWKLGNKVKYLVWGWGMTWSIYFTHCYSWRAGTDIAPCHSRAVGHVLAGRGVTVVVLTMLPQESSGTGTLIGSQTVLQVVHMMTMLIILVHTGYCKGKPHSAVAILTRVGITFIDILSTDCSCPTWCTLAQISIDLILGRGRCGW